MGLICLRWVTETEVCVLLVGLEDAAGGRGDTITNADAERVLLRVKQKLEGLEGGAVTYAL